MSTASPISTSSPQQAAPREGGGLTSAPETTGGRLSDTASAEIELKGVLPAASLGEQVDSLVELTKPRITKLVVITSGVGFALAAFGRSWAWIDLAIALTGCLAGTALSSAGASALNMWWERQRDALMPRTAKRPLPTGRLTPASALTLGLMMSIVGVLTLSVLCGPAPALVSLVTIALYVLVYTPLKTITSLNTIVGALPGALPPLIGWSAASAWSPLPALTSAGSTDLEASLRTLVEPAGWSLVALMVIWQIPHFLALAWMYHEDYAKGGYRMLPLHDPEGRATTTAMVVWALALLPATLAPIVLVPGRLGVGYAIVASVSGVGFFLLCVRLFRSRSRDNARKVFLGSIAHLPLILLAMVADGAWHAWAAAGSGASVSANEGLVLP